MSLQKLIEEVEYLYEPITGIYKQDLAMIHLTKNSEGCPLYMILKPEHGFPNAAFKKVFSTENASDFLNEVKDRHLNINELEKALKRSILDEITMIDLRREEIQGLVSEQEIRNTRESWNELRRKMLASIERLCNNEEKE